MNQLTVSLWRDEAYSVFLAKNNFLDIIKLTSQDTMPPLYHLILHFWMKIFGFSEIALRSFSLLSFFLLILTIYFFAKEIFKSKKVGIFAALLTMVNPFIFMYAFEARMYMLLMFLSVLSLWFFITKRWLFYIPATLAMIYTHNFAVLILFIECLSYLAKELSPSLFKTREIFFRFIKIQLKSPFLRSLAVVFIFYAPWIPVLYYQTFKVTGDFWLTKPDISSFASLYVTLTKGYDKFYGYIFVFLSAIFLFILRGFKKNRDEIFYYWVFIIPLIVFLISQFNKSVFLDRYLTICAPAVPLLLASQMSKDKLSLWLEKVKYFGKIIHKIQISTVLLLLMIILLFFANIYTFNHPTKQPFRQLTDFIKSNYPGNQQIINFYNDRLHYFELKYYGIKTKIYSPIPIPFWNGMVLVDQKDIIKGIPAEDRIIVMASQNIEKVNIPSYIEVNRRKINNLYLFWFVKIKYAKI